jgi:hypothetical protein
MARTYKIHGVSIDTLGIKLSHEPAATAASLWDALLLAANRDHHGPEGAAIVTPDAGLIYSAEEYNQAELRKTQLACAIVTVDSPSFGVVYSLHRNWATGTKALEALKRRIRRRNPGTSQESVDADYRLVEGRPGKRCERVRIG